jgi:hypothetical protein
VSLREKVRKADWLGEMQVALVVGAAAIGVAIIAVVWSGIAGAPVVARVPAEVVTGVSGAAGGLTGGGVIGDDSVVEVLVAEPGTRQAIAHALTALPGLLVALATLLMLERIVRGARAADPFTGATVRRLRVLAVGILVGGAVASVVQTVAALNLALSVTEGSFAVDWVIPGQWLLLSFGLMAVAEVIRRGAAMRAELATVI